MKRWLEQLVEDPDGSPSSTRVAGMLTTLTACGIAIGGVVTGHDQAGTVGALLGGGALAFFSRRRSADSAAAAPEVPAP
jgi:hypothetical protein